MLAQAFWQHRKGYRSVWTTPLPLYPWFGGRRRTGRSDSKLPPPVTAKQPKSGPVMESKAAPLATKAPVAPPKAADNKPTVYRSNSTPASKPTRATPARTQTQPAGTSAPARPKPAATKSTGPTPYRSASTKQYTNQYTRPVPQTKTTGQSNYLYNATKPGQPAAAPAAPPKRR